MATNLLARTYPAYSALSSSVSCPSVDFLASSSMRASSAGSARNRITASALSGRTISITGLTPRSNASVSDVVAMRRTYHADCGLAMLLILMYRTIISCSLSVRQVLSRRIDLIHRRDLSVLFNEFDNHVRELRQAELETFI